MPGSEAVPRIMEILNRGDGCFLTVTGQSMLPFLRHGRDAVLLESVRPEKLTRGRVVFFQRATGEYVLHRIRRRNKDGSLLINGDAQDWTERIRQEQVLAVAAAVKRPGGKLEDCNGLGWRLKSALWYPTRKARGWLVPHLLGMRQRWLKFRKNAEKP